MKSRAELSQRQDDLYDVFDEAGGESPVIQAKLDATGFLLGETDPIVDGAITPPKTDKDIDDLIARLRDERGTLPRFSAFGDPNWSMIDAQIEICEWAKGE